MTDIKTTTIETSEKATTEAITVGPNVEVRRVTTVRVSKGETTTDTEESVVYTKEPPTKHFGQFVVLPPHLPEKLRLTGWFQDNNDFELIYKKPFAHILSGEPYVVVRLNTWDNSMYDVEGRPLPVGMHFDYIRGNVANEVFHLTGLVDHLKGREDVTLILPRHAEEGKYIQNIEHYNRTKRRSRYVSFIWHPDVETYRRFRAELGGANNWQRYNLAHTHMGNDAFRVPEQEDDDE